MSDMAQYLDTAQSSDGPGVGFERSVEWIRGAGLVEYDAGDIQATMACGVDGQQRVVDRAQGVAGDDHDGPAQVSGEVGDRFSFG